MPRIRKTSTQPKRKQKIPVKVVKPIYPEYIQNFIDRVEKETPYNVKVDQYGEKSSYHIGVNMKVGKTHRCIWMVGFVDSPIFLEQFWVSEAYKSATKH